MNATLLLLILVALAGLAFAVAAWRLYRALLAARRDNDELRAQLRHVEAEALRLQTVRRDFVANISHELRTPLASIKLLVETLEDGALQDDTVAAEFTHRIGQETDHLIGMAQELLDLARLEAAPAMQPRPLDPVTVATQSVERMRHLASEKAVELRTDLPPALPTIWADGEQVSRVFVNLLSNAVKFTPSGGSVVVGARATDGFLAFSVADTGPGLPPGEETRIFERFYKADASRQRGGSGLGLSIARHIVQAQGGQIWARNGEHGGACFTFTLPLAGTAPS